MYDPAQQGYNQTSAYGNNSGQGPNSTLPPELQGLNWGAFLLNWIWGIGNNTWLALLALVPGVGFIMSFVLLVKGNEWAWANKQWDSVDHFKATQRKWMMAGLIILGIGLVCACISIILNVVVAGRGN